MMKDQGQVTPTSIPFRPGWSQTLCALRHRNFKLYWFGQLVSMSGTWMQIVAMNWLVYRMTNSPFILGLVNFIALLPVGLISPVAGVISDRVPRRNLILVAQIILTLQALVLALLTWTDVVQLWHIMLVILVAGTANAIEQSARFAFLMDIVGRKDFSNAVGLNAGGVHLARCMGPAMGGLLIGWRGEASCFFLNFLTYLAFLLAILLMQLPSRDAPTKPIRLKKDLLDGLRYIWNHQTIKGLLLMFAVAAIFSRPFVVLMPVFARDVLLTDSGGYGLLMGAVGVGAVCGALLGASIKQGYRWKWLLGVAFAFPMLLLPFTCSRWMPLSLGLLVLISASDFLQKILAISLLQLAASDEFQGRVASFLSLFRDGLRRLGSIQAGAAAQYWSAPIAVAGGALVSLVWMFIVVWRIPFIKGLSQTETRMSQLY